MTATTLEVIDMQQLEEAASVPCEAEECNSNHELPATWVATHSNGEAQCSVLICDPCKQEVAGHVMTAGIISDIFGSDIMQFTCTKCGQDFRAEQAIFRPI